MEENSLTCREIFCCGATDSHQYKLAAPLNILYLHGYISHISAYSLCVSVLFVFWSISLAERGSTLESVIIYFFYFFGSYKILKSVRGGMLHLYDCWDVYVNIFLFFLSLI